MITYLSDRRYFEQIGDKCSDIMRVAFDVPQRSILGPMIFDLYVAGL